MSTVTKRQSKELPRLARQPAEAIDTSEIPELTDWSGAGPAFEGKTRFRVNYAGLCA